MVAGTLGDSQADSGNESNPEARLLHPRSRTYEKSAKSGPSPLVCASLLNLMMGAGRPMPEGRSGMAKTRPIIRLSPPISGPISGFFRSVGAFPRNRAPLSVALLAGACLFSPGTLSASSSPINDPHINGTAASVSQAKTAAQTDAGFQADRAEILAMAGNYKVRFDMQETTPWLAGYTPIDRNISGGHEVVRVIEENDRRIILQHLLVVEHQGRNHIIKHWRQDWEYEPARILAYAGPNSWKWQDVPAQWRKGRWSQTVWQVDDSPRYAGWGQFETQGGVRRWRSNWTWRPLARRDATRKPVYDRYYGINRHQPSPDGWIHWQDNIKMGMVDGALKPIVQESVLNSYSRFDGFNVKAADDYWAKTRVYWAAIRARWDAIANSKGGIAIQEEAETGTIISARLLMMADQIIDGSLTEAKAIETAEKLINENTHPL